MLRFQLEPIESISPWITDSEPSLSWFALTLGWMVWPVGNQEIYRYRDGIDERLGWHADEDVPDGFESSVNYQLARPFRDIAECLRHWLEPVPEDVLERVGGPTHMETVFDRCDALRGSGGSESALEVAEPALDWCAARRLVSSYLRAGPTIRACLAGDHVHVMCDTRDRRIDGIQVWTAETVDEAIPVEEFTASMRSFGSALLEQMDDRLKRIEAGYRRPDVRLRPQALREQHGVEERIWSEACGSGGTIDWDTVRSALSILDL